MPACASKLAPQDLGNVVITITPTDPDEKPTWRCANANDMELTVSSTDKIQYGQYAIPGCCAPVHLTSDNPTETTTQLLVKDKNSKSYVFQCPKSKPMYGQLYDNAYQAMCGTVSVKSARGK